MSLIFGGCGFVAAKKSIPDKPAQLLLTFNDIPPPAARHPAKSDRQFHWNEISRTEGCA